MPASTPPLLDRVTLEDLGAWLRLGQASSIDVPTVEVRSSASRRPPARPRPASHRVLRQASPHALDRRGSLDIERSLNSNNLMLSVD